MNDVVKKPVCHIYKEAWQKVKGMKKPFWGAVTWVAVIGILGGCITTGLLVTAKILYLPNLFEVMQTHPFFFLKSSFVLPQALVVLMFAYYISRILLELCVMLPMRMGVGLIPLRHAADKPVHGSYVWRFFRWGYIWRFAVLELCIIVVVALPIILAVLVFNLHNFFAIPESMAIFFNAMGFLFLLFAAYRLIGYLFATLLIIDRKMSPFKAMKLSYEVVNKHFFTVFGALVWAWLMMLVGTLLLLIGLIWAVPYAQNVIVLLYRELLGIEGKDPVTLSGE